MPLTRPWPRRTLALALCAALCAVLVWQAAGWAGSASPASPSTATPFGAVGSAAATSSSASWNGLPESFAAAATDTATSAASATPASTPSPVAATRPPTPRPTQTDRPWSADPVLMEAKMDGRVVVDSSGEVTILAQAPVQPSYPIALSLDTAWTGLIQEPPKSGTDDKGVAYTDYNYILFCGPGTAAVVLYYWPASHQVVTTRAGQFVEPVDVGAHRYASTYWKAQDAGGYARGMIAYMAEVEWPAPDKGLSWWTRPGIMRWSAHPATYVENLVDALNWEASGHTSLGYFYVITKASDLTAAALLDHVHSDIAMGVPVVVAARTSDGSHSLPFWKVRSKSSAGNHFVTVVGYDDSAGTYTVMDTCGLTCNDRNVRAGVKTMSQAALYDLIVAESDNDGIMW